MTVETALVVAAAALLVVVRLRKVVSRRRAARAKADAEWKPTGIAWSSDTYDEKKAVRAARVSRTRTPSGRKYQRPSQRPTISERVVAFRKKAK